MHRETLQYATRKMIGPAKTSALVAFAIPVLVSCSSSSSSASADAGSSASAPKCGTQTDYSFRLRQEPDSGSGCTGDYSAGINLVPDSGLYVTSGASLNLSCTITDRTFSCPAHIHATCTEHGFEKGTCGNGPCGTFPASVDVSVDADGGVTVHVTDTTPYGTCRHTSQGA